MLRGIYDKAEVHKFPINRAKGMKRSISGFLALFLCLQALTLTGCSKSEEIFSDSAYVLGTIVTYKVYDHGSEDLMNRITKKLVEIEEMMSISTVTSDVAKINTAAGREAVQVSPETYNVIQDSIEYSKMTDGAFDISLGPIVNLWGIGSDEARLPEEDEITEALSFVGYTDVILEADYYVYLPKEGMSIDLGGIAKGYAADVIIDLISEAGVKSAIVNLGGNVKALGKKPNGEDYRVGIQNPFDTRNEYLGIVSVADQTVVTSGDYERFFVHDEVRYHHIFDRETGYPALNDIGSVSIISQEAIDADVLSTAIYVLGLEYGMALIESLEGIECIYVLYNHEVHISTGLVDSFELTDDTFTLIN